MDDQVVETDIFIGLMRPAMMLGIPLKAFVAEVLIILEVYIQTSHKVALLISGVVLHLVLLIISNIEIGIFEDIYLLRDTNRPRGIHLKKIWGCKSLAPIRKHYGSAKS